MKQALLGSLIVGIAAIFGLPARAADEQGGQASCVPLPLLFWDREDIANPTGDIRFDAQALEVERGLQGYPEMLYGCEVPRPDGSSWIYGWQLRNWSQVDRRSIAIVRCVTQDGLAFTDEETVFVSADPRWQGFVNLVRRPSDGALFMFAWSAGNLVVFQSADGQQWTELTRRAYTDHDAMCVTWHAGLGAFLNYQNTLEPFPKLNPDNIGNHRRVLSFRRSSDGIRWESYSPPFLQGQPLWKPDGEDPADLEFYRSAVFSHLGRYAMLLVDYIPPPAEANSRRATSKHGPRYLSEWAISRDGLNWRRPFRQRDVAEHVIWSPLQGPLVRGGRLRFYEREQKCASLPVDRLFFITCRANGEFSTPLFQMPAKGLSINALVRWRPGEDPGQAYLMAELRDEQDAPLPGYERARCLFENVEGNALPLRWGDKTGVEHAGRNVKLRIYLRDAKLFQVASG